MLRIKRLRTFDDPAFAPAMALYTASFPEHEQRLEQRRIMAHEQYHFGVRDDHRHHARRDAGSGRVYQRPQHRKHA